MITLNRRERRTLAATAAVLLALPSLSPLWLDAGWAPECAGAVLVVGVVGFLGRVLRFPTVLPPVLGLLGLLVYTAAVFAGSTLTVLLPTAETFTVIGDLLRGGSDDVQTLVTPVPTADNLVLLAVLAVGGVALLVDLLAVVAGRAALAGLPLLLLFAAPSAIDGGSAPWWAFALAGLGWLLVLLADGTERVHRWGVALAAPGRRAKPGGGLGYAGSRIAVAAVGFAVVLPLALPDLGDGEGVGNDGPKTITTYNPLTRLGGSLRAPQPKPVLSYTTDDPSPDYLRMTTLEIYDGEGWSQGLLEGRIDRDGVEDRVLPLPEGVQDSFTPVEVTIDIATLQANWLPAPATPSEVEVDGPWLWDEQSQSVFAIRTDSTEIGPYTVRSREAAPQAAELRAAGTAVPDSIRSVFGTVPSATPTVRRITRQVVAGKRTAYDKALALQSYFRSGDFEYSLRTVTGSSPDALESFLETKQGFCEQYASAMAAMLRLSGVPARVAVGFTPGTARADGSRLVTTKDAHAWPEAWIPGSGWLRFEPTPGRGYSPLYTARTDPEPEPSATPSATPSASASAAPGPSLAPKPDADDRATDPLAVGADDGPSFPTGPVLGLLAVLAVLSVPGAAHALRRRARWQSPGAGVAWAQLVDDTYDVGLPLDPSRSPRQVLTGLAQQATLEAPARAALERVTLAVERDRYAPAGSAPDGDLQHDVATVRHALHEPLPRRTRLRLLALPPSTVRWARDGVARAARAAVEGVAGLGATVGARVRDLPRPGLSRS